MIEGLKINLAESDFEYLRQAALHANGDGEWERELSLFNTVSSIDLLLKARLAKKHWSQVFADPNRATPEHLKQGDVLSVDFASTIKRLKDEAGVTLDPYDERTIPLLWYHRNRIQYCGLNVQRPAILSLIVYGLDFAVNFARSELSDIMDDRRQAVVQDVAAQISGYHDILADRWDSVVRDMEFAFRRDDVADCPCCLHETLIVYDEEDPDANPRCLFCEFSDSPCEIASEIAWPRRPRDCPYCGRPTLVYMGEATKALEWLCFACGQSYDPNELLNSMTVVYGPEECPECGERYLVLEFMANDDWAWGEWRCLSCDRIGEHQRCDRCGHMRAIGPDGICLSCSDASVEGDTS